MDVITMLSPTGLKSPVFLLKTGILILFLEEGGVLSCLLTVAGLFSRMHPLCMLELWKWGMTLWIVSGQ